MGFWKAQLVPDPAASILSTELLGVFNAWLAANGHLPWSKETFGPRFKQHDETTRHGVRLAKISKLESLSRAPWPIALPDVPRRPDAYAGVRFRGVTKPEDTIETEMPSD
jgi:putative DNA primase/helicase